MRERAKLHDLAKVGAAQTALQLGAQSALARHAGEHATRVDALRAADTALAHHYRDWRALLELPAFDPGFIALFAASVTRHEDALSAAHKELVQATKRVDASRLAYAHASVRVKSGLARQRTLKKRLARLAEERRMAKLEDRLTWGARVP